MTSENIYHGSPDGTITTFEPMVSSHKTPFVYGTKNRTIALMFIQHYGGDFLCSPELSRDGIPTLTERSKGALEARSKENKGWIYTLPGERFSKCTGWPGEVVSRMAVKPSSKRYIVNVIEALENEAREGRLILNRWQDTSEYQQKTDEELVEKSLFYLRSGLNPKAALERWQPHLTERVRHEWVKTQ